MANGDALSTLKSSGFKTVGNGYKLLDAQQGATEGEWRQVGHLHSVSVEIFGNFNGLVEIRACNQDTQPLPSYEGVVIDAPHSAPALINTGGSVRWIKAKVVSWTAGPISAYAHGVT